MIALAPHFLACYNLYLCLNQLSQDPSLARIKRAQTRRQANERMRH